MACVSNEVMAVGDSYYTTVYAAFDPHVLDGKPHDQIESFER